MPNNLRPIFFISHLTFVMLLFMGSCNQKLTFLSGAGATLPEPLYKEMFTEYEKTHAVKIHYYGSGSEEGITQLEAQNVDFGAVDALPDEELSSEPKAVGQQLVSIPTCLGAVAITYNLPGNPRLHLTGQLVAAIFMGQITFWNDKQLQQYNQQIELPAEKIQVFHRLDGSGTTFILSDYLSRVSPGWAASMGAGELLSWPTGYGCQGSNSLAMEVVKRENSIGYVGLDYAMDKGLPVAAIQNRAGSFVEPTLASISAAAEGLPPAADTTATDFDLTLTDTVAHAGYPLSSFSYLVIYQEQKYGELTRDHAQALCGLIWWMVHAGQRFSEEQNYVQLPQRIVAQAEAALKTVTYDNQPVVR